MNSVTTLGHFIFVYLYWVVRIVMKNFSMLFYAKIYMTFLKTHRMELVEKIPQHYPLL